MARMRCKRALISSSTGRVRRRPRDTLRRSSRRAEGLVQLVGQPAGHFADHGRAGHMTELLDRGSLACLGLHAFGDFTGEVLVELFELDGSQADPFFQGVCAPRSSATCRPIRSVAGLSTNRPIPASASQVKAVAPHPTRLNQLTWARASCS